MRWDLGGAGSGAAGPGGIGRSCIVVVVTKKASKMVFGGDDDVVEELATHRAHPTLGDSVLPRRPIGGARRFDAHVSHRGFDASAELPVAIED